MCQHKMMENKCAEESKNEFESLLRHYGNRTQRGFRKSVPRKIGKLCQDAGLLTSVPEKISMEPTKKILYSPPVLRRNEYRWYIEFYATLPGGVLVRKRKTFNINRGKTDEEKQAIADRVLEGFVKPEENYKPQHRDHQSGKIKLPECMNTFLTSGKTYWEQSTLLTYRTKLRVFATWLQNMNIPPRQLERVQAVSFMDYLLKERKVSRTTFNAYRATLAELYHSWPDTRKHNPFDEIKNFPDSKEPLQAFNDGQWRNLADHIKTENGQLYLFIGFMYYTFLRPAEICGLKLENIDFYNQQIKLPVMVGKTKRWRVHSIPDLFSAQLHHLKEQPINYYVFGLNGAPGERPVGNNRFYKYMKGVLKQFNYPKGYSIYSWRHTAAIELYKKHKDIYLVKNAMQHAHVSTTERYLRRLGVLQDERLYDRTAL